MTEIAQRAESLEEIGNATKTIGSANEKIAHRAKGVREALLREVQQLREHVDALRRQRAK